ncbi:MAG: hydroxymethylbilane synthase [Chloroflexota bacterium]
MPVRIGTRGSILALAQARQAVAAFERAGRPATTVLIDTAGDLRAPDTAWGEGAFVSAIEDALISDRVDVAVHSAKDVPTAQDPRLHITAFLPRADPRDALVVAAGSSVASLETLPRGARVGTDSPRRTGFLLALRPDLLVHPLHGNVDTRLRRLDEGATDALILATAGLIRLGREDRITEYLDVAVMPPAPGQGAIAIQVRSDDDDLARLGPDVDDIDTRRAVEAEREVLRRSGGGCRAPIGALAAMHGDRIRIVGGYALPDGSAVAIERVEGPLSDRDRLIDELVGRLARSVPGVARPALGGGARATTIGGLLATSRPVTIRRPRLIVTRPAAQAGSLAEALESRGAEAVLVPAIEIEPLLSTALERAIRGLSRYAWIVVTSSNGATPVLDAIRRSGDDPNAVRWATVGPATERVLHDAGVADVWVPTAAKGERVAAELPLAEGDRVLLVRAQIGGRGLPAGLIARGAVVDDVVVYRTIEGPESSRPILRSALRGDPIDAVLFTSGSAVRGFLGLAAPDLTDVVSAIPAICIGPGTAIVAAGHGFRVLGESAMQRADELAERAIDLLRWNPGGTS